MNTRLAIAEQSHGQFKSLLATGRKLYTLDHFCEPPAPQKDFATAADSGERVEGGPDTKRNSSIAPWSCRRGQRPLGVTHRRSLTLMAGLVRLVPTIHGLRVDPAEVVDASPRWHDGDHAVSTAIGIRLSGGFWHGVVVWRSDPRQ
jgi:hypothetical protein